MGTSVGILVFMSTLMGYNNVYEYTNGRFEIYEYTSGLIGLIYGYISGLLTERLGFGIFIQAILGKSVDGTTCLCVHNFPI